MMLQATDLAFGYGRVKIGHGVTLSVDRGEVLCLLGPNGCGKTTLFKTLLGLLPRQGGRLELNGKDIATFSRSQFARHIAYVPQATGAYFPFSVFDVVLMGRASRIDTFASPTMADRAITQDALAALGIGHLAARPFTDISGGEKQMTLIARALAQEPELIVMDEPTASLDFGNQARVLSRISSFAGSGMAVVISTHDPSHAFACASRVALMQAGALIAIGKPQDVLTSEALQALYGVGVAVAYLEQAGRHVCTPTLIERNAP
ncbi:MAG: ABC transporter ATP-binding protein [Proteobacteria bacterium]|uniref:ABC transporter ATP-binding protein n=1 Tax=Aminobacter sp. MET-1 TaxID=2951085 RepID=UPI002269A072|nr:ABC transporter ATP-binding protein [Aminobacter sp. MET-1]MCA0278409.1 ABC transporter ATP-binding protein [Pseudomonadota bacterium]MCX8572423.1 ABC transporter ATP-binding protein [Aminobacter sp. MET-1]